MWLLCSHFLAHRPTVRRGGQACAPVCLAASTIDGRDGLFARCSWGQGFCYEKYKVTTTTASSRSCDIFELPRPPPRPPGLLSVAARDPATRNPRLVTFNHTPALGDLLRCSLALRCTSPDLIFIWGAPGPVAALASHLSPHLRLGRHSITESLTRHIARHPRRLAACPCPLPCRAPGCLAGEIDDAVPSLPPSSPYKELGEPLDPWPPKLISDFPSAPHCPVAFYISIVSGAAARCAKVKIEALDAHPRAPRRHTPYYLHIHIALPFPRLHEAKPERRRARVPSHQQTR